MLTINLREEVLKAIDVHWPDFAREHPQLAQAIDRTILAEQAVACIADTEEFRRALADADAAGAAAATLTALIEKLTGRWIRTLR